LKKRVTIWDGINIAWKNSIWGNNKISDRSLEIRAELTNTLIILDILRAKKEINAKSNYCNLEVLNDGIIFED